MPDLTVKFTAFSGKIPLYDTRKLNRLMKDAMREHAKSVIDAVKVYPLHNPNSKYRRTGSLRRGWMLAGKRSTNEYVLTIFNTMFYATFVQGPKQVWYHALTGWKVLANFLQRDEWRRRILKIRDQLRG